MLMMGKHTGSQGPLPSINLFGHSDNGIISGTYEGPHGGVFRGHLFEFPQPGIFGSTFNALSSSWRLHCGADTPIRRVPTLACGWWSSLGVLSSIHQGKSDSSEFCQQCAVGTTSALGEISHPLPKDGKIAIIEGN